MITAPDLFSPAFKANPHPTFARLRAEGPVVHTTFADGKPCWLLPRYAEASVALKDPRFGKDPARVLTPEQRAKLVPWTPWFMRPLTQNMLDRDPPDHTRLRGLVHQAFTPARIEALRGRVEQLCAERLHEAKRRGAMDVVEDLALPVPLWVICDLLGVPEGDRMKFRKWTNRMISVVKPYEMVLSMAASWNLIRYVRSLAKRRRGSNDDDLLTALQRAEEAGDRLNEDELIAMIFILLVAGHETTVNLIASGTLALMDDPEQFERLRAEPALIKPAIEELLRFTSPIDIGTERYTTEEMTYGGHTIPRGERVFPMIGCANYDPDVFADPLKLKLDREPNRHLAFGGGPHYCLGAPLARLEAQIAFTALVRELPDLKLAIPRSSVRWKRSQALRGVVSLPVLIAPAKVSRQVPAQVAPAHAT